MKRFPSIDGITPENFELCVKRWIKSEGKKLESFEASHLEKVDGLDGEYKFDVTARFKAIGGADFLVIVECKKHKNPIKRDVVQALRAKQQAVGASKAVVVSTSTFQSGAIAYASSHGMALVQIISGQAVYIQNSLNPREIRIPENAEDYVGFFYGPNQDGRLMFPQLLSEQMPYEMVQFLK